MKQALLVALLLVGASAAAEDPFRQFDTEHWSAPNDYRNAGGAPGPKYWQQNVDYDIQARLDERRKEITGRAEIRYRNNSPDQLRYLWLHLDDNVHRRDSLSRLARPATPGPLRPAALHRLQRDAWDGGVAIKSVRDAAGKALQFRVIDTLMRVELPTLIAANGGEFQFSVEWSSRLLDGRNIGGFGAYECFDQAARDCLFLAGMWFPRLAVYSDFEGWHNRQFLAAGGGEFALEFGDYRVSLTVPADHVVAATGELTNASQVLTSSQRERLALARDATEPVFIVTPKEALAAQKNTSAAEKTWMFQANQVRDFAWASSRKFIWDAMGVKQRDGRVVMAMSFYPNEATPLWEKYSTRAIAHALRVIPELMFDYPYPTAQSVDSPLGGVEFPMISFSSARADTDAGRIALLGVVFHEVAHNYLPMIVNTDERQWTWFDEGLVAFLQFQCEQRWDPHWPSGRGRPKDIVSYMLSSAQVPVMTQADSLVQASENGYAKPATAFNILRETILGPEVFDQALREFAAAWRFKRPTPTDFFRSIEESSGVDLDWFWRGWFYSTAHVDIALEKVVRGRVEDAALMPFYRFSFRNVGGVVMPIIVQLDFSDGTSQVLRLPAEIWRRNPDVAMWDFPTDKVLKSARLDPLLETADANTDNNVYSGAIETETFSAEPPRRIGNQ